MNEFFELMLRPFLTCLILVGIHTYLGLHVVQRGVIFVDLALAQVAAFGATFGFLLGYGLHSYPSYLFSLATTLVAAGLFAATRHVRADVPQEAYIGIIYAVAAAASVIVLSRAPEGGEELRNLLVGHLLFVEWHEIVKISLIYSVLGVLHWLARRPLLEISKNYQDARSRGVKIARWDFFFYATFGIVVTSSVELAGVLLVFSFLIVPSVCGVLLAHSIRSRLLVGWGIGFLTSVAGVSASYFWDLPTGATVVCAFGVTLILSLVLKSFLGTQLRES